MPILYNSMERVPPGKSDGKRYWCPVVKSTGLIDEKKVAETTAKTTAHTPKEVELLLSQLSEVVMDMLLDGKTVQLGKLGFFRTTVKAAPADSEEEVTASKIKKVTVRFKESDELKNTMKKAKFVPVVKLLKKNR